MIGLGSDKNINSGWPQIRSLAPFILNVFTQNHHVFITKTINTKTPHFGIGHRLICQCQFPHTCSGNVANHSIYKSILFWSLKIHREITVNLINLQVWAIVERGSAFATLGDRFRLPRWVSCKSHNVMWVSGCDSGPRGVGRISGPPTRPVGTQVMWPAEGGLPAATHIGKWKDWGEGVQSSSSTSTPRCSHEDLKKIRNCKQHQQSSDQSSVCI